MKNLLKTNIMKVGNIITVTGLKPNHGILKLVEGKGLADPSNYPFDAVLIEADEQSIYDFYVNPPFNTARRVEQSNTVAVNKFFWTV